MMVAVSMLDGSTYNVKELLANGDTNAKLTKSNASGNGYLTVGLSLSPANESGYETCASRSAGCTKACLFTAGRGQCNSVKTARIAKTRLFFQERDLFLKMLFSELRKWEKKAFKQGSLLACRLNIVSDIMWENICPALFTGFPTVQFYDYTKHMRRALSYSVSRKTGDNSFPANYHLTFSRSESNLSDVNFLIENDCPINIAVVFDTKILPSHYIGREVINGDETDLRFLDKEGTIVGLYAKGRGRKDTSGFVVPTSLVSLKMVS
jgi:hypothetical protein